MRPAGDGEIFYSEDTIFCVRVLESFLRGNPRTFDSSMLEGRLSSRHPPMANVLEHWGRGGSSMRLS